jgi:superfamily II DNA or RNA helicase
MIIRENHNYGTWFTKRGKKALPYQNEKMNMVLSSLTTSDKPTVFAACPNAGKTLMSTCMMDTLIQDNPNMRILVLAHGTTVLRKQFAEEIRKANPSFTVCEVESKEDMDDCDAQVVVAIPQSIYKLNNLPNFDLLIVDEAHEFYGADMVTIIIHKCNIKHQLMLTGTPSTFIFNEFPIIPITVSEIAEYGMVAPLTLVMAGSKYNIRSTDYTNGGEVNKEYEFIDGDTVATLDNFLTVLNNNLRTIENEIHVNETGIEFDGWKQPLEYLDKTMIVCRRVEQARQVKRYFDRKGIDVALSTGEDDTNSDEIQRFKDDANCHALIVVGRGILGFSFEEMINVVDMTGMQNIDRLFQLICRVIRKHPTNRNKYFFKIVPEGLEAEFTRVMQATMMLTDEEWYTKYNGQNFANIRVPGFTRPDRGDDGPREPREPGEGGDEPGDNEPRWNVTTEWLGVPDGLNMFKNILITARDKTVQNYSFATIREIKVALGEIKENYRVYSYNEIEESSLKYDNPTKWQKAEPNIVGAAIRYGCYHDVTKHMNRRTIWTLQLCKEEGLKYNSRKAFQDGSQSAYAAARNNDWLEECCQHMTDGHKFLGDLTKEECLETCKKARIIREIPSKILKTIKENGWYGECTAHMNLRRLPGYWTLERCIEQAKKFRTTVEWQQSKGDGASSYKAAMNSGWLGECKQYLKNK